MVATDQIYLFTANYVSVFCIQIAINRTQNMYSMYVRASFSVSDRTLLRPCACFERFVYLAPV